MRITIFGATGGTGKQLVEQALAEGNEVVAFARKPSKLNIMDKNLTIVQGELTDEALIENAVKGADAVISYWVLEEAQEPSHLRKACRKLLTTILSRRSTR